MKYLTKVIVLLFSGMTSVLAQDTITYNISFPNAIHHEAEINIQLENIKTNHIKAIMSKTSPGRYAVHDFGKNVYNLQALGENKAVYQIQRIEPDVWAIDNIQKSLNLQYTIYANHADGTYSGIDADFANLNMPATFMWLEGLDNLPIKVVFNLPDTSEWKIATQLILMDSLTNTYFAPDLKYFMDSPCIVGNLKLKEFRIDDQEEITIRLAINTDAKYEEIDIFKNMLKGVVLEQKAVFHEFPEFDENTYSFLCSYGPGFYGDGMEHRNSTMISSNVPLAGNQNRLIGTIAHEFFHVWNMERIRPESLEPFDFRKPAISGELWFGEGFTSYYGDLTLCRAGILDQGRYIGSLSSSINYAVNSPGWKYGSPVYMSELATYADRSSFVDETNYANTFLSYYDYGQLIALALDLTIRAKFDGKSLDDVMNAMWINFGRDEIPYNNPDIENALAEVCNDQEFARTFFERYIYGNEMPDFEAIFDQFGYKLIKKNPGRPGIGYARLKFEGDTATLVSDPLVGTGLYEAGVNKGDLILRLDGQPVTSYPELNFIVGTRKVGDELEVQYSHFGRFKKGTFKLKEENQLLLVPKEKFSIRLEEKELQMRDNWLSSKVKK
jgi:predicted metalloprotease with PDZ domain